MKSRMTYVVSNKSRSSGWVLEKHFIHAKGLSSYPTHETQGKTVLLNDLDHIRGLPHPYMVISSFTEILG